MRCTCEECYKHFIAVLKLKDPEMISFAEKFKNRWYGYKKCITKERSEV